VTSLLEDVLEEMHERLDALTSDSSRRHFLGTTDAGFGVTLPPP
jgi:hypothetical protein